MKTRKVIRMPSLRISHPGLGLPMGTASDVHHWRSSRSSQGLLCRTPRSPSHWETKDIWMLPWNKPEHLWRGLSWRSLGRKPTGSKRWVETKFKELSQTSILGPFGWEFPESTHFEYDPDENNLGKRGREPSAVTEKGHRASCLRNPRLLLS